MININMPINFNKPISQSINQSINQSIRLPFFLSLTLSFSLSSLFQTFFLHSLSHRFTFCLYQQDHSKKHHQRRSHWMQPYLNSKKCCQLQKALTTRTLTQLDWRDFCAAKRCVNVEIAQSTFDPHYDCEWSNNSAPFCATAHSSFQAVVA